MDRNGYFRIVNKPDGTYIQCFDAMDNGSPVNINDIIYYLDAKNIKEYDLSAINNYLAARNFDSEIKVSSQTNYRQNEHLKLEIDKMGLKVIGRFFPPTEDGEIMTREDIIDELRYNNITFGYVSRNIDIFCKARLYCTDILLAKAEPPVHGHDASIEYFFETSVDSKPKLNDDGSVDFHQLGNITHVKKGERLAHLTLADLGKPGTNVFGKPIPPKKVERKKLRHGINISVSDDGLDMYSDVSGHVSLIENIVYVSNVYEVPANVDASTGDIDYDGEVNIKGNVNTGYSVKASGDIIINGVVEGAKLEAGGDIIIGLGVQGTNRAVIKAGGNIVSKFFENCVDVVAEGTVTTDAIMHSNVRAKGNIEVKGKRGLITGGTIISGNKISMKTAGSNMGTITKLEIGIDPDRMELYHQYEKEVDFKLDELEKMKQTLAIFQKMIKNKDKISPEKMQKLKETNELFKQYQSDIDKARQEMQVIMNELDVCKKGKIYVSGTTFFGVVVTIAGTIAKINDEAIHTCYVREGADIRFSSY